MQKPAKTPMTSQRRAEMERLAESRYGIGDAVVTELLAEITYWREAVKNADIHSCPFCGVDGVYLRAKAESHKPDCPWLLAQDKGGA